MLLILNEEDDNERELNTEDEAGEVIELNQLELKEDTPIELKVDHGCYVQGNYEIKRTCEWKGSNHPD